MAFQRGIGGRMVLNECGYLRPHVTGIKIKVVHSFWKVIA